MERVYGEGADGAGLVCQENTTWLAGGQVGGRYMLYEAQFANETDVYEYDFGSAPAIQTATANGKTWFVCPGTVPANAARWRHTDYVATSAYTAAPVHLRRLARREQARTRQGTVVGDTVTAYDNQSDSTCALSYSIFGVGTGLQRDTAYGTGLAARGNARCVSRWRSGTLGWATVSMRYDTAGNAVQRYDERGNLTSFDYTDQYDVGVPPAATKALPTTVTNALGHTTRLWYDYGIAKPARVQDANGVQTSYAYADALDRLTGAARGGYETVSFVYQDWMRQVTTRRDLLAAGDQVRQSDVVYL